MVHMEDRKEVGHGQSSLIRWVPSQNGWYKVNTDGVVFWKFQTCL